MTGLFALPEPGDERGPCVWCGEPSVARVEIEPPMFGNANGVRVLKRHAIEVDVCQEHAAMVARNKAELEAVAEEKQRRQRARRAPRR